MGSFTKKFASASIAVITAVTLSGVAPLAASAQSASDTAALIANLQAQIAALQAKLGAPAASASYNFTRNLTVGSKGNDVKALQSILISKGYLKISAPTSFFGALTKAAVASWQKEAGISPASGFVGPISRGVLNGMSSGTTGGTTGGSTGGSVTPVSGQVTMMAGTNQGGSIISGAAQVPVMNFKVANGTGSTVTVTGLKFTKTGVVSDSNISNAYLSLGSNIVAQYVSLSGGVVTFSGNLFDVPAGQTVDVTLRVDVASGTSNGNTIGFNLAQAGDATVSAGTVAGTFPVVGATFVTTSVSNPSLATVSSVAYQGVATQVDAGSQGFLAGALSLTVNNSAVKLQSVRFSITGSVNMSTDLKNLVLKLDGAQVATAASLAADGKAYFDLSATPVQMNTGSHRMEVYADVMGTPYRDFTVQILRPFDWVMTDTQYNTSISAGTPSGTATKVSVRQGTVTVSLDSSTPTGNLPIGGTNLTLAKFALRAAGEPVKVKWMNFQITEAGSATWATSTNVDADIRNVALYGDDGQQVGTTINTPSTCSGASFGATTFACSFGTSASNINYIIPANTTRVMSLKVDLLSTADVTSLKGSLTAPGGSNLEGQISYQTNTAPGGTIDGSNLTIVTSPFTASQNSSLGTQTVVGGSLGQKVASFSISASSAEGINLTSVTLLTSASTTETLKAQQLKARVGSTDWNYAVGTLAASQSYTFSSPGSPTLIPAGGSVTVDVYEDVLTGSTAGTYTAPISLAGAVGTGVTTNTNQTLKNWSGTAVDASSNKIAGQNLLVAGTGSISSVSVSTSNPQSGDYLVLGDTGATLAEFTFNAGPNEDIKITDITVTGSSTTSTAPATFRNFQMTAVSSGTTYTGTAPTFNTFASGTGTAKITFQTPLVIKKSNSAVLTLKGDMALYLESTTSHNQTYTFSIATSTNVTAKGVSSSNDATLPASSFPLTAPSLVTLKTKVLASVAVNGSATRVRSGTDDVAKITMTPASAGAAKIEAMTLKFSGKALNATNTFQVSIMNEGGTVTYATSSVTTVPATNSTSTTLTFTSGDTISAAKAYLVRIDSTNFAVPTQGTNPLEVRITGASWSRNDMSSEGLSLPASNLNASTAATTLQY